MIERSSNTVRLARLATSFEAFISKLQVKLKPRRVSKTTVPNRNLHISFLTALLGARLVRHTFIYRLNYIVADFADMVRLLHSDYETTAGRMNGEETPKTVELETSKLGTEDPQPRFFSPSIIPSLSTMSLDQLSELEEELLQEFALLSREYVQSRGARIDHLISVIDKHLKVSLDHDLQWSEKFAYEVELIGLLIHGTEDAILSHETTKGLKSAKDNFEIDFRELMQNLHLPLATDTIFSTRVKELPFAHQFEKIIEPYRQQLSALWQEKDYQIKMIDSIAEDNKIISWKQYRQDVSNYRQKLIDQTYSELTGLYEEYHGIRENATAVKDEARYHRSVISTDDIKYGAADYEQSRLCRGNIDSFYDIDNVYYKNNKIATTGFKTEALNSILNFESAQAAYKIPQVKRATVKLSGCQGASEQELEQDLEAIRSKRRKAEPLKTSGTEKFPNSGEHQENVAPLSS